MGDRAQEPRRRGESLTLAWPAIGGGALLAGGLLGLVPALVDSLPRAHLWMPSLVTAALAVALAATAGPTGGAIRAAARAALRFGWAGAIGVAFVVALAPDGHGAAMTGSRSATASAGLGVVLLATVATFALAMLALADRDTRAAATPTSIAWPLTIAVPLVAAAGCLLDAACGALAWHASTVAAVVASLATAALGGLLAARFARRAVSLAHAERPAETHAPVASIAAARAPGDGGPAPGAASDRAHGRAPGSELSVEQFFAGVADELRGPLEEIGGLSAALLSGGRLAAAQAEDVALILAGSGELLGLVDLALAPPQASGGATSEVDLGELARDVVRAQRPAARQKRLVVEVTAGPEARVRGDERRLRQVVTNLVANAIKFTPEGRVVVGARRVGEGVELSVEDEGVGIAEDELLRLFQPYAQAGDAAARARGTGLGLLSCKQIVEAHGGTISVESALGRGSRFLVRLPALRDAGSRAGASRSGASGGERP